MADTITRDMVVAAFNEGILQIRDSQFYGGGVVACVHAPFGDCEFFCSGFTGESLSADEFLRECGIDVFIDDVLSVLTSDFITEFPNEYSLYYSLFSRAYENCTPSSTVIFGRN